MTFENANNSFYFDYYRIGQGAYRQKVHFFEANREKLEHLDFEQQNEVRIDYLICLFEIGRYEYFLDKVDTVIEIIIIENIYAYDGKNIYTELLFKKSACLYNLNRLGEAEKILKSIVKIDENHTTARNLYTICRRRHVSPQNETVKAVAMVGILSAMSIAFMEIFIVKPFYNEYISPMSMLRNVLLIGSLAILIGAELYFKYNIGKDIGFKLNVKDKIKAANKWFLQQSGGKIDKDKDPL